MGIDVSPAQRIEDMIRVTEFCIDLLKENEEHHGEVSHKRNASNKNWHDASFLSSFLCRIVYFMKMTGIIGQMGSLKMVHWTSMHHILRATLMHKGLSFW